VLRGPRSPIPLLRERMPGRGRPADNRSRNSGTPQGAAPLAGRQVPSTKALGSGAVDYDAVVAPKGRHGFREEVASMSKGRLKGRRKTAVQYEVFESFKRQLTMNDQVCPVDLDVRT
jgi:hypothetical protein